MTTEQPRCDKCRWSYPEYHPTKPIVLRRECRKNAPRHDPGFSQTVLTAAFPTVNDDHWCGEFEAKPE